MTTAPDAVRHYDWSVLQLPGVETRTRQAVASVANATSNQVHLDRDDLAQEAALILAGNADKVREYVEQGELGHLYTWLRGLVQNKATVEVRRSVRNTSYEKLTEGATE